MRSSQTASLANLASRVNSVSATTMAVLVFASAALWIPVASASFSTLYLLSQQPATSSDSSHSDPHDDGQATICTHFTLPVSLSFTHARWTFADPINEHVGTDAIIAGVILNRS
jgi:hypothetical protein